MSLQLMTLSLCNGFDNNSSFFGRNYRICFVSRLSRFLARELRSVKCDDTLKPLAVITDIISDDGSYTKIDLL